MGLFRKNKKNNEEKMPIEGIVKAFQANEELGDISGQRKTVWSFRLDRFDKVGNQIPSIPVQMEARHFSGFIREDDKIKIFKDWKEGELLKTDRVFNVTIGIEVRKKGFFED